MTITLPKSAGQFASKSVAPRILPDLSAMQAMMEQQAAMIEALKSELESKSRSKSVSFKITAPKLNDKGEMAGSTGALSVYGVGRFPLTLYKAQWLKLIAIIPDLQAFIKANETNLSTKD